ncbi:CAAX prenyl protease 1 -like protein [Brachionus plicatilis]|uniref:CAAX prenyl protease n=1 Tax=Brachionus plicatilis TaxID=10195 RepID=A0A3M7QEM5_BRAPC|nr:CAAX prenyl protease 1 -like protein [Brachionus plicatilis]
MSLIENIKSSFDFVDAIDKATLFNAIIIFMTLMYLWETYLSFRQYLVQKNNSKIPEELVSVTDKETFDKSRLYAIDKALYNFVHGFYSQLESYALLYIGALPYIWNLCSKQLSYFSSEWLNSEISISCLFIIYFILYGQITGLPWSIYYNFVLEEKHGFNKQTFVFFMKDNLKKLLVSMALSLPILALLLYIIKIGGDYFFIYAWVFITIVSLFIITIYADYIAPLFDKYVPLQEGELKSRIEGLAKSLSFPLYKLYVKEEKTKGCNTEEILAVLAHELGHWKLGHNVKNLLLNQINTFLYFLIFAVLMNRQIFYSSFGFEQEKPVLIGLIVILQFIFAPYNELLSFLMVSLGRRFEFQADEFAKKLDKTEHLKSSLIKLHKDNLSFPMCDWLYSAFHYSHPPLLERLRALDAPIEDKKRQ